KLQAVGLRGAVELMPDELSGGMKRRVALARAIALDPQILLYDEPFAGQDPLAMGVLVKLIRLLNDALGITSIVVSHDLAETSSIADYIYVVGDGQVLGQGTPAELRDSTNPRVQQFMRGAADGPVPFHFPAPAYAEDLLRGPTAYVVCYRTRSQSRRGRPERCWRAGARDAISVPCTLWPQWVGQSLCSAGQAALLSGRAVAGDCGGFGHLHRHGAGASGLQHS